MYCNTYCRNYSDDGIAPVPKSRWITIHVLKMSNAYICLRLLAFLYDMYLVAKAPSRLNFDQFVSKMLIVSCTIGYTVDKEIFGSEIFFSITFSPGFIFVAMTT